MLLVGLAAEPDDHVRADRDPGDGRTDPLEAVAVVGDGVVEAGPADAFLAEAVQVNVGGDALGAVVEADGAAVDAAGALAQGERGTDLNQPLQPVVRISQVEALAFCRWLSEKLGEKATLPTEAQWEWACRAGTETPFNFGGFDADFSRHANLADAKMSEFASDPYTVDVPLKNPTPFDDWIPKDDTLSILKAWRGKLREGGTLEFTVTDFDAVVDGYGKGTVDAEALLCGDGSLNRAIFNQEKILGLVNMALGHDGAARDAFERVLSLFPLNMPARVNLDIVAKRLGGSEI